MDLGSQFRALKLSSPIIILWGRLIVVISYYSCPTKSRKLYQYIFYFLLDVAITNAFVLFKDYAGSPKEKTIQDFRVKLAKELIRDYCSRRRAGRQGSVVRNLLLRHFPVKLIPEEPSR